MRLHQHPSELLFELHPEHALEQNQSSEEIIIVPGHQEEILPERTFPPKTHPTPQTEFTNAENKVSFQQPIESAIKAPITHIVLVAQRHYQAHHNHELPLFQTKKEENTWRSKQNDQKRHKQRRQKPRESSAMRHNNAIKITKASAVPPASEIRPSAVMPNMREDNMIPPFDSTVGSLFPSDELFNKNMQQIMNIKENFHKMNSFDFVSSDSSFGGGGGSRKSGGIDDLSSSIKKVELRKWRYNNNMPKDLASEDEEKAQTGTRSHFKLNSSPQLISRPPLSGESQRTESRENLWQQMERVNMVEQPTPTPRRQSLPTCPSTCECACPPPPPPSTSSRRRDALNSHTVAEVRRWDAAKKEEKMREIAVGSSKKTVAAAAPGKFFPCANSAAYQLHNGIKNCWRKKR